MPLLETSNRLDREQRETRETREKNQQEARDGAMADGLIQTNKIARESQRGDMELFRQIGINRQTDKLTDSQSYSLTLTLPV